MTRPESARIASSDSQRWCEHCEAWGDHHTDRHDMCCTMTREMSEPHTDAQPKKASRITEDRNDPRLTRGIDDEPGPQNEVYLVLSEEERSKGFIRPVRRAYIHAASLGGCGAVTTMGVALSETYARDPRFYGATYCCGCQMHRPVGADGEFLWDGTNEKVGT